MILKWNDGKKGHLTFEERALSIWRGGASAPHAIPPTRYATEYQLL